MGGMDGFEVCRRLKFDPRWREIPVIFLTSLDSPADEALGLSLGAEDFIQKPYSPPVVLARVRNQLTLSRATRLLKNRNDDLERLVQERTREIREQTDALVRRERQLAAAQDAVITAFCSLAEARDNETGNHIRRTQNYVRTLAEAVRRHPRFAAALDDDRIIALLFKSAPLHDIGKVAIPDAILLKPGRLTPEEWDVMKTHCLHGREAIALAEATLVDVEVDLLRYAKEIAYGHHERWDGSGYPQGLSGDAIPVSARLMALADVYDALTTRRVYKPAFPHAQAVKIMLEGRGTHVDPDLVAAFERVVEEFRAIAERYADEDASATA
jgi:putative two-component system response regulator